MSGKVGVAAATSVRPGAWNRARWASVVAPALVVLLGLGFALVPLSRGRIFFYWDNAQQHYAQTEFLHHALRAGHLPSWWPQVGLGFPTTAEGQAAHYDPIRVLLAWAFPTPVALMLEIGFYLAVAGLGTYLFTRELRLTRAACVLAGICQMFGSFSIIFIKNVALHRSFCLLPLAMFFAERIASRGRLSSALPASLLIGLQFLSGHPTFAVVTVVAATCHIFSRVLQRAWNSGDSVALFARRLGWPLGLWSAAVGLGLGLGAVQVIPTLLHDQQSMRAGGLSYEYADYSLRVRGRDLLQVFYPYAYEQGDWLRTATKSGSDFNMVPYSTAYLGALPVLLALLGLWWSRKKNDPGIVLLSSLVLGTGFAMGSTTPLFPALWSLPGMNGFRYPHRFLMWSCFSLACLAGVGLHRLIARGGIGHLRSRDATPYLALSVVLIVLAFAFWVKRPWCRPGVLASLGLFGVAAIVSFGLLKARRRYRNALVALAILFAFSDLMLFRTGSGYAPTIPIAAAVSAPPIANFLRADRDPFRVMSLVPEEGGMNRNDELREFMQADLCSIWGIDSADVWLSLLLKRYYVLREAIEWELEHEPDSAQKLASYLGAWNVKYVLAPHAVTLPGWERAFDSTLVTTWKNPSALPQAFVVGKIVPEKSEVRPDWEEKADRRVQPYRQMVLDWSLHRVDAQIVDQILSQPLDFRTTAVVAGSDLPKLSEEDPEGRVRILPTRLDEMRFEVESHRPALLVVSSSYYPGWTATADGRPERIVRTNWVTMGVFVPAGTSRVALHYVTPGLHAGMFVSLACVGVLIGGLIMARILER